jgi:hypothetical protein
MIQACVFYRTHTLLSIHLDILNPHIHLKPGWVKLHNYSKSFTPIAYPVVVVMNPFVGWQRLS